MFNKTGLAVGFTLFCFCFCLAEDDTMVVLFGKQTKRGQRWSAKLESSEVTLEKAAAIVKVEGARTGFWVNQKQGYRNETVYKFWNAKAAVGKRLNPGTYTVYPNLPAGEDEEIVKVYLDSGSTAASGPATSPGQARRKSPRLVKTTTGGPSVISEDFLRKYCKIYLERYQDNYIQAYGINPQGSPEDKAVWGVYENVDICAKTIQKTQHDTYEACLKTGGAKSKCEELNASFRKMMEKGMTHSGCLELGKSFRCSFYNIGNMSDDELRRLWGGGQVNISQEELEKSKRFYKEQYDKCVAQVVSACKDLPASVNW
jgi:hypothetical protein